MSLEPATESERLYLALGGDVNPARPIFTGDELLENWATDLEGTIEEATAEFESWIRAGSPSRQQRLLDYAERAPIRRELRDELRRRTQLDDKI